MTALTEIRRRLDWLISRTRLLLDDPNGEKYAQTRIIEAINFSCLEVAISTEIIKDEINMLLQENQWYYDIAERVNEDATKRPYGYPVRIGFEGNESPGLIPTTTATLDWTTTTLSDTGNPLVWRLDLLSYGQIAIDPIPRDDGTALPSESGNIQATYVAMPNEMTDSATDYPDTMIPAYYHELIPFFAAKYILDEGDAEDMAMGDRYLAKFDQGKREIMSDAYNNTSYGDVKPM